MRLPVQLEGVGTVSVCGLLLQIARQVHDRQSTEWTFLEEKNTNNKY